MISVKGQMRKVIETVKEERTAPVAERNGTSPGRSETPNPLTRLNAKNTNEKQVAFVERVKRELQIWVWIKTA